MRGGSNEAPLSLTFYILFNGTGKRGERGKKLRGREKREENVSSDVFSSVSR